MMGFITSLFAYVIVWPSLIYTTVWPGKLLAAS